jgi:citrate synthase
MASLKEVLAAKIPVIQAEIRDLIKNHGSEVVSEVTLKQVYGGMRGVKGLVCDTSMVDPIDGLIIRGIPLAELTDRFAE